MKPIRNFFMILMALMSLVAAPAFATDWNTNDIAGGKDHPLIKRFAGSWLVGYQNIDFDSVKIPTKLGLVGMNEFDAPQTIDGNVTRLLYLAPLGKRPVEVHKNYMAALTANGFKSTLSCTPDTCDGLAYGLTSQQDEMKIIDFSAVKRANPALEKILYRVDSGDNIFGSSQSLYMDVGTITSGDKTAYIVIYTDKHYTDDADISVTFIEIIAPKDMQTGQVTVDLNGLQTSDKIASGMNEDGKIALYGVYFDTGKTDIKPESKAQMDEIAKFLTANPTKKVFIVGHTDNQGAFAGNVKLSIDRAKAVVGALSTTYKIAPARLSAQGVANMAPMASNSTDTGRAKNRRVEIVEQ